MEVIIGLLVVVNLIYTRRTYKQIKQLSDDLSKQSNSMTIQPALAPSEFAIAIKQTVNKDEVTE